MMTPRLLLIVFFITACSKDEPVEPIDTSKTPFDIFHLQYSFNVVSEAQFYTNQPWNGEVYAALQGFESGEYRQFHKVMTAMEERIIEEHQATDEVRLSDYGLVDYTDAMIPGGVSNTKAWERRVNYEIRIYMNKHTKVISQAYIKIYNYYFNYNESLMGMLQFNSISDNGEVFWVISNTMSPEVFKDFKIEVRIHLDE
jgi:hypothetical protein